MKFIAWRSHKARPADYESVDIGARVEIDTEVDTEYADMPADKIGKELDGLLDDLLDKPVDRVLRLGGSTIEDTHLWDFYERD